MAATNMHQNLQGRVPGDFITRFSRSPGLVICGITLIVQFVLASITFPISELFTNSPLFYIDGAYHWYEMKLAASLAVTGNVVGYDPFFAAGHPDGIIYNFSAKFPALLAALVSPGISEIRVYKLYVFVAATLAPLAIPGAAMVLRFPPVVALGAAVFGLFMWWVTYFHWYFTAGMVGYVTACYLGILFVAFIVRYSEGWGSTAVLVGIGLFGAIGFFTHPVFPIPVAFLVLTYLATSLTRVRRRRLPAVLLLIPVVSLLPNLIWIFPTYHYQQVFPLEMDDTYQKIVDGGLIWRESLGMLRDGAHGSKAYPLLLIGSLWACFFGSDRNSRGISLAFLAAAVALELFAYLGAISTVVGKMMQPNRFAPVGYLFLCIPAAQGLRLMFDAFSRSSSMWQRAFAGANIAAAALACSVLTYELVREVTPGPHGRYGAPPPQVKPLGNDSAWVIDWLQRRTTANARVLFETSLGRVHDEAHMAGYYAYAAQREFIGGPYPFMHFAGFWDGWLFGKRISDIPGKRMAEYLSLYNIGWILVHSDAAKQYFGTLPGVRLDGEYGKLRAYVVEAGQSYFLQGSGQVQARGHNNLLLGDITGDQVVLKYHYVPGMTTEPPVQIEGMQILDDPKPFVRIANPPARLRLFLP
jgi:hypothetical protein